MGGGRDVPDQRTGCEAESSKPEIYFDVYESDRPELFSKATPSRTVGDPHDLAVTLSIERDGKTVFEGSTTTGEMATTCETLVDYLGRHNTLPETVVR